MNLNLGVKPRVSLLAGAGLVTLCSAAFASPALAKPYTLNVGEQATKGKATAKGNVTFP